MSDTFNVTITEENDVFNVVITEQSPITVTFSEIAVVDPTVAQAKDEAVASASEAEQAAADAVRTLAPYRSTPFCSIARE